MALMIIVQNIHAFNCRSENKSSFEIPLRANPIFVIGIMGSIVLGLAVVEIDFLSMLLKTVHVPYIDLLILILFGSIILLIMEIYKKIKY